MSPRIPKRHSAPRFLCARLAARVAALLVGASLCWHTQAGRSHAEQREADEKSKQPIKSEQTQPVKPLETIENSLGMKLVKLPAGEFLMGSPDDERAHQKGEFLRKVKIEKPFYIGMYEVTQSEYERVTEENPSAFRHPRRPVENINWGDAMEFCRRLGQKENQTYRLPTDAEWEYACRAGTTTPFHFGDTLVEGDATFDARYPFGSEKLGKPPETTTLVGSYKPNAFGLYDMHGNVREWCLDVVPDSGSQHLMRGGCGGLGGTWCRSAQRDSNNRPWQWYGFRVVRTVEREPGEIKIPNALPIDQIRRFNTAEMIAKVDEAFARPAAQLLPPVVIFPVVDAERRVRDDGVALSSIASYALEASPDRRMELCNPSVWHRLRNAGCLTPKAVIDDRTIDICLAALSVERYVLPQLVEEKGELKLTLRVQTKGGGQAPGETKTHSVAADEIASVAGVIARDVLEHLGAKLSDADIKSITALEVKKPDDLKQLGDFASRRNFGKDNRNLLNFIQRNPRCMPAWMLYVFESTPADQALNRYRAAKRRLASDRLEVAATVRDPAASQDVLLTALELAPKFQSDTYYHGALNQVAQKLSDPELVEHLLQIWRKHDASYFGCTERGQVLMDWAWRARGGGWAQEVPPQAWGAYKSRIRQAREELEKAVAMNPLGWEAHAKLITLAMNTGLPRENIDKHFKAAIEICPRHGDAYERMRDALQPYWGGTREEMLSFANTCLKTDYWAEGVPEIGRGALESMGMVTGTFAAYVRSTFKDPAIWENVQLYSDNAMKSAPPDHRKYALNWFAKVGAFGGHYEDVAKAFQQLEKEGTDPLVFWDSFTYGFLRDLVFSQTGEGDVRARASVRAAMDRGDLEQVEQSLAKLDGSSPELAAFRERCQRALKVARQLQDDRQLELTPAQMHAMFDGVDSQWKVEGDELVCRLADGGTSAILFPIGIEKAVISGALTWLDQPERAQIHAHTRAMRDNVGIAYVPDMKRAELRRGSQGIDHANLIDEKQFYQLELDQAGDVLRPTPNVAWPVPVVEHAPSGFGFQVTAAKNHPAVVKFGKVRIELKE